MAGQTPVGLKSTQCQNQSCSHPGRQAVRGGFDERRPGGNHTDPCHERRHAGAGDASSESADDHHGSPPARAKYRRGHFVNAPRVRGALGLGESALAVPGALPTTLRGGSPIVGSVPCRRGEPKECFSGSAAFSGAVVRGARPSQSPRLVCKVPVCQWQSKTAHFDRIRAADRPDLVLTLGWGSGGGAAVCSGRRTRTTGGPGAEGLGARRAWRRLRGTPDGSRNASPARCAASQPSSPRSMSPTPSTRSDSRRSTPSARRGAHEDPLAIESSTLSRRSNQRRNPGHATRMAHSPISRAAKLPWRGFWYAGRISSTRFDGAECGESSISSGVPQ